MVIISQQHFLYNPAIFIPINATSIPAPTRHPPQISILMLLYAQAKSSEQSVRATKSPVVAATGDFYSVWARWLNPQAGCLYSLSPSNHLQMQWQTTPAKTEIIKAVRISSVSSCENFSAFLPLVFLAISLVDTIPRIAFCTHNCISIEQEKIPLDEEFSTSHTTVRTVRYTAVQST